MGIKPVPTKGMSVEALKAEMLARELDALSQYKLLRRYDSKQLAMAGYKAAHEVIDKALKMNEARLLDWERNNPD